MSLKYVQTNTFYQAGSGVIIGATSIVLTTFSDIYGNVLTMTDFGSKGYGTCESDTTNEESFTFTGVVANANGTYTLTGISTALAKSPYTETSGLVRAHSGGTKVVISDTTAFWNTFANLNNANTFTILPQSAATPTANADFVTKLYADQLAIAGAPNSTLTVKGIVQLATQAQVLAKIATGSTGAALTITPDVLPSTLLSDYKVDTGSANAYAIAPAPAVTAYTVGQIFSFKAVNANTTASTINVNALGVKSIKRMDGSALLANDILAGQIVVVEYDGTNFIMISPTGNSVNFNGSAQYPANDGQFITKVNIGEVFPRGETVNGATTPVPVVLIDDTFQEEFLSGQDADAGKVTTGNKLAFGFKLQGAITLTTLKVYLKKASAPTDNLIFTIQTDNAGTPSGTPVTNGTANSIAGPGLTTSYVLTTVTFGSTVTLAANTQYWLVAARDSTASDTNYYRLNGIADANKYASFTGSTFNASSWSTGAVVPYVQLICTTGNSTSVWRCSTNHANFHMRYALGLVTTDGTISTSTKVIFRGIVQGFTGLIPLTTYYAQDSIGTIGSTVGTTEAIVGTALSITEIVVGMDIQKNQYISSQTITSTGQTVNLPLRTKKIVITAAAAGDDGGGGHSGSGATQFSMDLLVVTSTNVTIAESTNTNAIINSFTASITANVLTVTCTAPWGSGNTVGGTIYFYR
jgi:hypothetical protein